MKLVSKVLQNDNFIGIGLGVIAFAVYLSTLATTVQFEDCGELATAVATGGITHPTGYPLLSLLGWVFARLPFDARVITKLNLLVALLCSIAAFFFHRLFLLLLSKKTQSGLSARSAAGVDRDGKNRKAAEAGSEPGSISDRIAAAAGALVLAFSASYWAQAVSFEVYALHLLFMALVSILFLKSLLAGRQNPGPIANRAWMLFAFVLGLSFTNHMMTVLLAPAFLYLYFTTQGFGRDSWMKIGKAVIPFLAGLSLYLYLPVRALQKPLMNWGNAVTFENFWWHISGRQYQYSMFASPDVAVFQFKRFVSAFPSEFGYVPLLFALLGLGHLFRRSRVLLAFSCLIFLGCLFYAVNYNVPEISPYFLPAYVATAIWIAFGIRVLLEYSGSGMRKWIARAVCIPLFLWPLLLNYRVVDLSGDHAVEDYARNVLGPLEPGAVIFTDQSDYFTNTAYYLQWVEGVRPDVILLDLSLSMNSWYYPQMESQHPGFLAASRPQIEAFLHTLFQLNHGNGEGLPHDEDVFRDAIQSILSESDKTRPVYVTAEIPRKFMEGFFRFPAGLTFRLFRRPPTMAVAPIEFSFRPISGNNPHNEQIRNWYATAYLNEGIYSALTVTDTATGIALMRRALAVKPDFAQARYWLGRLGEAP